MKTKSSILFLTMLSCFNSFSQGGLDPVFSQYFTNALYLNPALAGSHICPRIKFIRRDQWPGVPTSYTSNYLSYDQYHFGMEAGFGFTLSYDNLASGMLSGFSLTAAYSKKIKINREWNFTGGLQAGWGLNQLNWNKLNFADQLDSELGFVLPTSVNKPGYTSKHIFDVNTGILFDYESKLFVGFTGHHLTNPKNGFIPSDNSRLSIKYSAYISYEILLKNLVHSQLPNVYSPALSPSLLYQRQGRFNNILGGAYFNWYPVLSGVWFRHAVYNSDAIIFLIGFEQQNYKIHYSLDITLSKLTFASSWGSHEFSFTWQFACPSYMKKRIKAIKCPSFYK